MKFSCENNDDATRAFMTRTSIEARGPIADVTVPLYSEQAGKTLLCGTGVLVQIAEKHFIVSAGHTFDARRMLDLPMWVTNGVVGSKLIPLGQVTIRSSETNDPYHRTDDPFDTAVCELSTETAAAIGIEKRFLRLVDVDPWDRQHPQSWYMVFGYPTALNPPDEPAKSINSDACAFATFLYCNERGELSRYDAEVGIALDFNPAAILDDAGNSAIPPRPHGMSGCGIWRLVEAGTDVRLWKLDDIKLVANQHTLKLDHGVLTGTRIRYALQMIYRNHADLRSPMKLHFGAVAENL